MLATQSVTNDQHDAAGQADFDLTAVTGVRVAITARGHIDGYEANCGLTHRSLTQNECTSPLIERRLGELVLQAKSFDAQVAAALLVEGASPERFYFGAPERFYFGAKELRRGFSPREEQKPTTLPDQKRRALANAHFESATVFFAFILALTVSSLFAFQCFERPVQNALRSRRLSRRSDEPSASDINGSATSDALPVDNFS